MLMKILLAEDEIALSRAYATALEMQGYEVVQAFDGERALELANNEVFNLMIFDIMMPKKSYFIKRTCSQNPFFGKKN